MTDQPPVTSKLKLSSERVVVNAWEARDLVTRIFQLAGCSAETAEAVAAHLTDASLCGVESHGLMRTLQYVEQMENGYLRAAAEPVFRRHGDDILEVDGGGGIGIPAMEMAVKECCAEAKQERISALAIRNLGHTGRLGAFAEEAANAGCLIFIMGGGNREQWRQVAPYGGRRAMLPTNPYCIGIPGGDHGPVVLDFATSRIAGGWIYAARSAGAQLPPDSVIDRDGHPTQDPEDYFQGGAILPAGGAKGYALALMAELIAEALLGPVTTEANWLMIALDTTRFREPAVLQQKAEEILAELRACPPAPGFDQVEIPGERERACRAATRGRVAIPEQTWRQINALADRLASKITASLEGS